MGIINPFFEKLMKCYFSRFDQIVEQLEQMAGRGVHEQVVGKVQEQGGRFRMWRGACESQLTEQ